MGSRLGQHFLRGTWAARALVRAANLSPQDVVLEIGPGKGVLTRELLVTGARIVAVEKDANLVDYLREAFTKELAGGQLRIISADIRDVEPKDIGLKDHSYTLAANIPYYITGDIFRTFLSSNVQPRTIVLLVQKEVAQRIAHKAEGRRHKAKESILSISVKAYGVPKIIAKVPRGNFSPPPKVDSAILLISDISREFFEHVGENRFFAIVRAGFSSKRKLLANNLAEKLVLEKTVVLAAFVTCGISEKARAENVSLEKWKCLAEKLM